LYPGDVERPHPTPGMFFIWLLVLTFFYTFLTVETSTAFWTGLARRVNDSEENRKVAAIQVTDYKYDE
jgi:hypothetical protein